MTRRLFIPTLAVVVAGAFFVFGGRSEVSLPVADHPASATLEQLVERFEECGPTNAATTSDAKTATAEPDTALARSPANDCIHVVYVWSPRMPLSELAVEEIEAATDELHLPLSILPASEIQGGGHPAGDEADEIGRLRDMLIAAGGTVHYPSIVVFRDGEAQGNAFVGHKRAQGYRELLEARLAAIEAGEVRPPAPIPSAAMASVPAVDIEGEGDDELRVVWTYPVRPKPGFFFRRVPGTRYITFDQSKKVYLLDLETNERLLGPGFIDFVPSPDGKLFVTPRGGYGGLEFYVASEVVRLAEAGETDQFETIYLDRELDDQYPSVGILDEDPDGRSTTYRIVTSWFKGIAMRDYEVTWRDDGTASVTPLSPKLAPCPGMVLSTPILSKDGTEIAARDESTGTTKVFRLHGDGSCDELFDLGVQTSKVGFSDDGTLIAFSSMDPSLPGRGMSSTYVFDRRDGRSTKVPDSGSEGLVIPEMVGPDSLLFMVTGPRTTEFRMICCVR